MIDQNSDKIPVPKSKLPIPSHAKKVFEGVIFDVYQWEQKMFDGSVETYEKLKRNGTVEIIAVTKDKKIIVLKESQPARSEFTNLISGRIERGETPLETARKELLEEAGMKASTFHLLWSEQRSGKIDWPVYIFVARDCEYVAEQQLEAGEKIELLELTWEEFVDHVIEENFKDQFFSNKFLRAKLSPKLMTQLKARIISNRSI